MKSALVLALIASIATNVWLYRQWQLTATKLPLNDHLPLMTRDSEASRKDLSVSKPSEILTSSPPAELNLDKLTALLNSGQFSELKYLLQQKLRQHPNNIELLLLEAELMMKTEPLSEALLHYHSLLKLPLGGELKKQIQQRITQLLQRTINELKETQSWELLAQFLEPLFQQYPTDKQITLGLAEAYGQQRKYTLMEDTLASLSPEDAQLQALRQRLRVLEKNQPDEFAQKQDVDESEYQTVPLQRYGDHYLIDVLFGSVASTLLIDTGASTTAVTQDTMNSITQQQKTIRIGVFTLRTAAGVIESEMNQVFNVSVGEFSFPQLNVMTLENTTMSEADGLLGMNVLRHFEFRIDQQRSVLLLKLRNSRS